MKINGKKLEAARTAARVTRSNLAVGIGQTHVRVWQLCTEAESNVNELVGNKLAEMLNVPVEAIQ